MAARKNTKAAETKATEETTQRRAVGGSGGAKGQAIVAALRDHPDYTRAQIAEAAGATVARVGEVIRWGLAHEDDDAHGPAVAFQEAKEREKAEKLEAREAAKAEKRAAREAAKAAKAEAAGE